MQNKKLIIIISLPILILAVVGGGAWYFKNRSVSVLSTKPTERVRVPPPEFAHDRDRDGVSDEQEIKLGTSDKATDSDGDGLSDKKEIEHWKTDPAKFDTDGDSYGDGLEVLSGHNPLK